LENADKKPESNLADALMENSGRFPMTENPDAFKAYFLAALRQIP
jgi:hypothetical protein